MRALRTPAAPQAPLLLQGGWESVPRLALGPDLGGSRLHHPARPSFLICKVGQEPLVSGCEVAWVRGPGGCRTPAPCKGRGCAALSGHSSHRRASAAPRRPTRRPEVRSRTGDLGWGRPRAARPDGDARGSGVSGGPDTQACPQGPGARARPAQPAQAQTRPPMRHGPLALWAAPGPLPVRCTCCRGECVCPRRRSDAEKHQALGEPHRIGQGRPICPRIWAGRRPSRWDLGRLMSTTPHHDCQGLPQQPKITVGEVGAHRCCGSRQRGPCTLGRLPGGG